MHRWKTAVAAAAALTAVTVTPLAADSIRIAYNSAWPPYSSGADDDVRGLLMALTHRVVGLEMGLDVTHVGLPWARVQRDVEEGRADAMVTFASETRLAYADASSEIVLTLETRAVARVGSAAEAALRADPSIETHRRFAHCVMLADDWSQEFMTDNEIPFGDGQDTAACLRQVAAGRQDVFLHAADTARDALSTLGLSDDLVILPKVYRRIPLRLLVSKRSDLSADFLERFDASLGRLRRTEAYQAWKDDMRALGTRVHLATLDWPPFTGHTLEGQGPVSQLVTQVFHRAGIKTDLHIVPWKRAIAYAKSDAHAVVAYFPGYHCDHESGFTRSRSLGQAALRLAERIDNDITWRTLDDLRGMRVGTVVGYANTPEFDQMVADGEIRVSRALNDRANLRALAEGRVDAAVVDGLVFRSLLSTAPLLAGSRDALRLDERPLQMQTLYLCFADTGQGMRLRDVFDRTLERIDVAAYWAEVKSRW